MNVTTFEATIVNGLVQFDQEVDLPERTRVLVVVPAVDETTRQQKFDLAEMVSRMPADYTAGEFDLGKPVGREEW